MIIAIVAIVVLLAAYLFLIQCRSGHPKLKALQGWAYAHRGLHGNGVPENSMEAFRLAKEAGYGVELDVHLMADGNLAVIHDASLLRTAGVDVQIEDLTTEQLEEYSLEGTEERIPEFQQVLDLFDGKAPIIVELKAVSGSIAALCSAVCKTLDNYSGDFCIESFDPRCVMWLKKNRPDLIRGQLSENFFASAKSKLPWYLKLSLTCHLMNFLIRPDFIAYRFSDRKRLDNFLCRKLWGAQGVAWTLKTKEEYDAAIKEGWLPIFENFNP